MMGVVVSSIEVSVGGWSASSRLKGENYTFFMNRRELTEYYAVLSSELGSGLSKGYSRGRRGGRIRGVGGESKKDKIRHETED